VHSSNDQLEKRVKRVLEMALSTTRSLAESFFAGELEQKLGQQAVEDGTKDRKEMAGVDGSIKPEETDGEDEDNAEEEEDDDSMLAVIG
jgi:hypothetical protein